MNEWFILEAQIAGQKMFEIRKWSEDQKRTVSGGLFVTKEDAKRTCEVLNARKVKELQYCPNCGSYNGGDTE